MTSVFLLTPDHIPHSSPPSQRETSGNTTQKEGNSPQRGAITWLIKWPGFNREFHPTPHPHLLPSNTGVSNGLHFRFRESWYFLKKESGLEERNSRASDQKLPPPVRPPPLRLGEEGTTSLFQARPDPPPPSAASSLLAPHLLPSSQHAVPRTRKLNLHQNSAPGLSH